MSFFLWRSITTEGFTNSTLNCLQGYCNQLNYSGVYVAIIQLDLSAGNKMYSLARHNF